MVPGSLIVQTIACGLCYFLLCSVCGAAHVRSPDAGLEVGAETEEDYGMGDLSAQIIRAQDAEEGDWRLEDEEPAASRTSDTKFACPSPEPPSNGFLRGGNFDIGGVVNIFCEQGYTLQGPTNITCVSLFHLHTAGGLWVPEEEYKCSRWPLAEEEDTGTDVGLDHELPAEPIDHEERHHSTCYEPPAPENGYLKGDNFHLEGVVFIYCEEGYSRRGPSNITCVSVSPLAPEDGVVWEPREVYQCLREGSDTDETAIIALGTEATQDNPLYKVYKAVSKGIPGDASRPMPGATIPAEEQTDSWVPHRRVVYQLNSNLVEGLDALCALPRVVGPCKAAIPRFFFDTTVMECRPFTYGGCSGNENNFETLKECQFACR